MSKKTVEEIEQLKIEWQKDPQWEIEETEGFEDYRDELTAFRFEKQAEWQKQSEARKTEFQRNEPAFPLIETGVSYGGDYNGNVFSSGGLTKREYFAAMAMQAMAASCHSQNDFQLYPLRAVQIADALIAELNK